LLTEKNIPFSDITLIEVFNDVKKLNNLMNECSLKRSFAHEFH